MIPRTYHGYGQTGKPKFEAGILVEYLHFGVKIGRMARDQPCASQGAADLNTADSKFKSDLDVAIIIPHYDDTERLERCLSALMLNNLENVEVLVIDNGSPIPPGEKLLPYFPTVRFLTEPEKGAGPARNRGVRESRAPILAFLDADCIPASDWVNVARAGLSRGDVIGGRVDVFDETPAPRSGAEAFEAVFAFQTREYIETKGFSITANLITSRVVFEDVGPFRPHVSEDAEWGQRATSKGYRLVYDDRLLVRHPSRNDWTALRSKWLRLTREDFALQNIRRPGLSAKVFWTTKALAMPVSVVLHLPKILSSSKIDTAQERMRCIGTLARLRFQRMIWMLKQINGRDLSL
ncbi:MAG: glycosyltransferase family 2 protein [Marinosulfonomonas sp.]